MTKRYDRAYFDKWYRRRAIISHEELRRKVHLAVVAAEYFLCRPIRNVLDVGCGEGAWLPQLRILRKRVEYIGLDSSDYAIETFGASRNVRRGSFGDLAKIKGTFDLVVCSDVLHYIADREIRQGLPHLVRLTGGVAFLEVLTREDDIVGDLEGLQRRPAEWYRRSFTRSGLRQVGAYTWIPPSIRETAAELETCG